MFYDRASHCHCWTCSSAICTSTFCFTLIYRHVRPTWLDPQVPSLMSIDLWWQWNKKAHKHVFFTSHAKCKAAAFGNVLVFPIWLWHVYKTCFHPKGDMKHDICLFYSLSDDGGACPLCTPPGSAPVCLASCLALWCTLHGSAQVQQRDVMLSVLHFFFFFTFFFVFIDRLNKQRDRCMPPPTAPECVGGALSPVKTVALFKGYSLIYLGESKNINMT